MRNIRELFKEVYDIEPLTVARAPGRLEILGNHTDYNEGFVLSAAVGQATEFALIPAEGRICELRDFRDGSMKTFDLDDIDNPVPGDWSNYVKGMICELRKRGKDIQAFKGAILSTIPLSAGMSSSAALEISAGFAFKKAFGIDLSKEDWARAGQGVENNYMGLQSGLLDQFSSIFGKEDSLIFCDFRSVTVEKTIPVPGHYVFVVANSMVKHNLVDSEYNSRRISCENVAEALGKKYEGVTALRDVSSQMLNESKDELELDDYLKAAHVVGENERVIKAVEYLSHSDIEAFGQLMYESQESSQHNFTNSCPEIDCLVELSKSIPGCLGARLSGGGFGGITIHLVEADEAELYCERLKSAYHQQTGKETETIICSMGNGASVSQ
jgi:galactokinase